MRNRLTWCNPAQCWIFDMLNDDGTPILTGIPLVTGSDLLEQFAYLKLGAQLFAQTDNDPQAVPTFDNLGQTGRFYLVSP